MSRTVTILLVEDDVEMLNGIADLLEAYPSPYNMHILKADNGKAALTIMAQTTPDLIVSDIMMPEMEGFEFLQHVRQNPEWVHIPFVFLSARGKEGDIRKGRLSDADLYLTKPFATGEVAELIQTQLGRSFERQQRREKALESLKKNMMQILNHEFRTPLTYVTAYYEMLENSLEGLNYREHLRGIQAGCDRLTLLVSDLIVLVDLRSGAMTEQFQQQAHPITHLPRMVQSVIDSKQKLAAEKRVRIEFTSPTDLPAILGEPVALQAIFEHILDNSIKFSRPSPDKPGLVRVDIYTLDDHIHLAFQDEGPGIPAAMHERIFDLFEQHNRTVMEQQGAGIGLTIAKALVELHNGRIQVTSAEHQGSTFTVILPIYTTNSHSAAVPYTYTHGRIPATVLLVEDEINLLQGLADLLEIHTGKYDLRILTALNGREGLKVLQDNQPDLIISDIMMPHMDGYQFLAAVRESSQWVDIPFIFLTAKGEKRDQYEGYRLGVEEYITKPYDTDDVLRYIEKQLDKRFQAQQTVRQDFDSLKRSILKLVTPELMQPLTAVSIHTEKLAQGLEQTHSQQELTASLREIQEGGVRLSRLIEDLITMAELQTGETAVSYNWHAQPITGFGLLLYEMSQVFAHHHFPGTHIECTFKEQSPPLYGNSQMLMECVERLLRFIIHYGQTTPETVSLDIRCQSDEVFISLTSPVALELGAFNHFQQTILFDDINFVTAPDYIASLYIVKQYLMLHHGRLQGDNTAEAGCCFTIALPIYTQA